jgi:hypothetical protein
LTPATQLCKNFQPGYEIVSINTLSSKPARCG